MEIFSENLQDVISTILLILNNHFMVALWITPLILALMIRRKLHSGRRYEIIAMMCVPFILYFFWAATGLWSVYEVALLFNRMGQVGFVLMFIMLILGLYNCEKL